MALRTVRVEGDPILTKVCRPVEEMNERTKTLIQDMLDTMNEHDGVGLAAPQVGVLRRIIVIDVGKPDPNSPKNMLRRKRKKKRDDDEDMIPDPHILINPEIIESDGEQTGAEACLSIPDKCGNVTRPNHVIVKALNENMEEITLEGEELLARAICHEIDHLNGHLFREFVEGELQDMEPED